MIKEIHQISGVGRFKNFTPIPPIELAKISVVYGENGKGKSSLAAIFRSISDGNLDELDRRTTIGLDKKSIVFRRDDGGRIAYSSPGLKWSQTLDDLLVFDETFVHDNVCIGPRVDIDQRRNLNAVILGDSARQLGQEEQETKAKIKGRNSGFKATKQTIESKILRGDSNSELPMSLEDFIQLQPVPDIVGKIAQQKQLVDQLRSASVVLLRGEFVKVVLPEFPTEGFERLLTSSIENVEAIAEASVKTHLDQFSEDDLEDWIERGTEFSSEYSDDCPYCGQSLQTSSIIQHYQAYFSDAYKTLKSDVEEFPGRRLRFRSGMDSVNRAIAENVGIAALWRTEELEGLVYPNQVFETINGALNELVDCAEKMLAKKTNRPLEPLDFSEDFNEAYSTWTKICLGVSEYNRHHEENNRAIRKHKEGLAGASLDEAEARLLFLENSRTRYTDEVAGLCHKFSQLTEEQKADRHRLKAVQAKIKKEVKLTYAEYGERVNWYLRRLNADFTIGQLKQRLDGTKTQALYPIVLHDNEIPVDGDKLSKGGQSYKNTLSEGDRRTLALAFFLARLKKQARSKKKILVFDDPVTSMDDNRSAGTADLILAICERVGQVFILSHRKRFLRNFWIKYRRNPNRYGKLRLFEVCPQQGNVDFSEIRSEWDIKRVTESDFDKDLRDVVAFINASSNVDKRVAALKLRVVLESHYKSRYPDEFTDDLKKFGDFISRAENCTQSSPLYPLKKDLRILKRLNEDTSTFHHAMPLDLDEADLRKLCRDTLDLMGRRY